MSQRMVKIGLVGPGGIARIHVDAIRRVPGARLVAVAASTPDKARLAATTYDIEHCYGDYRELLRDKEVEAVHITTPNRSHYEIARDALAAGKHVICEKPLANSAQETKDLLEKAEASGLVHAVCHIFRFYPILHHLRALVAQGDFGRVHTVHGSYLQDWLRIGDDYNWRVDPAENGPSRVVADIGTHWLDLVRFLTGLPVTAATANLSTILTERRRATNEVIAHSNEALRGSALEDSACVLLDFGGTCTGCLVLSQIAAGHKNSLTVEINGTKASAAWNSQRPNELWIGYRNEPNKLMISDLSLLEPEAKAIYAPGTTKGILDTWPQFLSAVYREITSGVRFDDTKVAFATFADGHKDIATLEAIIASHQTRRWTDVAVA